MALLEHGGRLRQAAQRFDRPLADWLDLSTGLSPRMYPVPPLPELVWHRLPEHDEALVQAACACYRAKAMLAVAGSQAALAALPRLRLQMTQGAQAGQGGQRRQKVLLTTPSYAEHLHHWRAAGHEVHLTTHAQLPAALAAQEFDVVLLVNPNNPSGDRVDAATLLQWAVRLSERGGWLLVDEAFADVMPQHSVAHAAGAIDGLIVLRSVGKFFGLAGLRLGFVAAHDAILTSLAALLGPWTISTAAQIIGKAALQDEAWQQAQRAYLQQAGTRLQTLLQQQHIDSRGTLLFQWLRCDEANARLMHHFFAERGIWLRLFVDDACGIRIGLPGSEQEWQRLQEALQQWRA